MAIHRKKEHIPSAPIDASIFYPAEDGEPMAVSDLHTPAQSAFTEQN